MYVYISNGCFVPKEARKVLLDILGLELQVIVSRHVSADN